jgi:phenylpyruvate tautomerase PptA (4-oxalocrotonate tautomerase family)
MAQVKLYGRRDVWGPRRTEVSDAVHAALVGAWGLPADKRFHRFVMLDPDDLVAPRSEAYLVIEIVCFTGRTRRARRALIAAMFADVAPALGLAADDLEVVIIESPAENWGIRGVSGDELALSYRVDV